MHHPTLIRGTVFGFCVSALLGPAAFAEGPNWAEPEKVAEVEAGEREEAEVTWWGFDPEDATAYLQAAIDSGAAHVTVPDTGQTWHITPIDLTHDDQTLTFEEGVVVEGRREAITGRGDNLFEARNRQGITLIGHGATLRMPFVEIEERDTNMGGHLVFVNGSSDILIEGLTLEDGMRDAIYVGSFGAERDYSENVTVRDVVTDRNFRQGISIVSVDGMLVEDSVFKNTQGKSPQSGIDAETHNTSERITNVVVRNNEFLDNQSYGIHNWHSGPPNPDVPISIVWEGNRVSGGQIGLHVGRVHEEVPGGRIVFRDNVVQQTRTAGILVRSSALEADVRIEFIGNTLEDTSIGELDEWWLPKAPIVLHSRGGGRQGNIHFEDTIIRQSQPLADRPAVEVTASDEFEGWEHVTGTIRVDVPGQWTTDIAGTTETFELRIEPMNEGAGQASGR